MLLSIKRSENIRLWREFIILARPKHWFKSVFILVGYVFSGLWTSMALPVFAAVLSFGFAASAIYIYNDIIDLEGDKTHPLKKHRPLASGRLQLSQVYPFLLILTSISLAISLMLSIKVTFLIILYFAINIFYSIRLKRIPYLDVLCIGSGFMIRILMGTWAIGIMPSHWLLLCGTSLSLFLAFGKRKLELDLFLNSDYQFRPVLNKYSIASLNWCLGLSAVLSIYGYSCYVFYMSQSPINRAALIFTIPLVIFGFIRYFFLIRANRTSVCPISLFLSDRFSIMNLVAFVVLIIFILS